MKSQAYLKVLNFGAENSAEEYTNVDIDVTFDCDIALLRVRNAHQAWVEGSHSPELNNSQCSRRCILRLEGWGGSPYYVLSAELTAHGIGSP